ncbi:MAG: ATP-binding protein [Gemmatimonadota bacterium]
MPTIKIPSSKLARERQETEEALARREQQLADAQQIAQLGSWEWDVPANDMSWSDEMFRIAGYDGRAFDPSYQAFLGIIHPDDRSFVERRIEQALATPICLELECRIVRPDGGIRAVHCRAEVVAEDGSSPLRMIGTAHDVTELRRFAAALASQVEQLQQLSHASVAIHSAEGLEEILEVATGHAMRILGARLARGSIVDPRRDGGALVHLCGDDGLDERSAKWLYRLDQLEHPVRLGLEEIAADPQYAGIGENLRDYLTGGLLVVPLVDLLGGASGSLQLFGKQPETFSDGEEAILVQIAQITSLALQKARLFDDLQASEERYRRLFDAHLSGDFVAGVGGTLLEVNHTLARLLGYGSPDSLRAANVAELYRDPTEWEALVERVRTGGGTIQHETELVRADGESLFVILQITGLRNRSGELAALQGSLFDITERMKAEAALRESQQQLLQAQKMEAVGQLAGGIAHDFNNMLMAIQGFANLLEEEVQPAGPGRAHLGEIRNAAERSARLTRQLLAYSRKQVLQPEVLDLNAVIVGMEGMLKRLIGAHITFTSALEPAAGRVHADPGQLQQVLMNLVLNARDAMPDGGRLGVQTGNRTVDSHQDFGDFKLPPGIYTTLAVEDSGCGITADVLPRIYEPFYTTKPVGNGTGLGLSTVYGIVKQTGGYVHAESRPGQGTTFTIYLPRTQAVPGSATGATTPSCAEGECGAATVLVAEDESVLRTLAGIVLRRSGFRVLEAEDGVEALQIAEEHGYAIDLLVTDLVMPRMGGEGLAATLLEHRPDLKVIFMSGYAEEAVARNGLLAEGSTFLEKPFSPSVLARTVKEVLGAGVSGEALPLS